MLQNQGDGCCIVYIDPISLSVGWDPVGLRGMVGKGPKIGRQIVFMFFPFAIANPSVGIQEFFYLLFPSFI